MQPSCFGNLFSSGLSGLSSLLGRGGSGGQQPEDQRELVERRETFTNNVQTSIYPYNYILPMTADGEPVIPF